MTLKSIVVRNQPLHLCHFFSSPTRWQCCLNLLFWSVSIFWTGALSLKALAEEQTERAEMAEHYLDEKAKNPSIFQGTPVSHVVPALNTVSYALALRQLDATITAPTSGWPPQSESTLKLSGYTFAPYLSLSLKRIGLGFSVESGRKAALFTRDQRSGYLETRSAVLGYRGVGAFVYWIPFGKIKNFVTPTVILGGRNYSAKQEHTVESSNGQKISSSLIYSVPNYEAGLNVNVALFRSFSMIPWANYSKIDLKEAQSQIEKKSEYDRDYLQTDTALFWKDHPDLTYGIDFAARLGPLQVRLGGLLGIVATAGGGSERIEDKSLSLALSYEQKGN